MGEKELRDPSLMKKEEDLAKGREKKVPDRSNSWGEGREARETWYIWRAKSNPITRDKSRVERQPRTKLPGSLFLCGGTGA